MPDKFMAEGARGPQLVQSYIVDDPAGFSVTVYVGGQEAFCTCRDFYSIDWKDHYSIHMEYYGATGPHGCAHIDHVVGRYGWQPNCDHYRDAEGVARSSQDELVEAFAAGLRMGSQRV